MFYLFLGIGLLVARWSLSGDVSGPKARNVYRILGLIIVVGCGPLYRARTRTGKTIDCQLSTLLPGALLCFLLYTASESSAGSESAAVLTEFFAILYVVLDLAVLSILRWARPEATDPAERLVQPLYGAGALSLLAAFGLIALVLKGFADTFFTTGAEPLPAVAVFAELLAELVLLGVSALYVAGGIQLIRRKSEGLVCLALATTLQIASYLFILLLVILVDFASAPPEALATANSPMAPKDILLMLWPLLTVIPSMVLLERFGQLGWAD